MKVLGVVDIEALNETIYDLSTMLVDFMGPDQGIGSSDISCVMRDVIRSFGIDPDECTQEERMIIRDACAREISDYTHKLMAV